MKLQKAAVTAALIFVLANPVRAEEPGVAADLAKTARYWQERGRDDKAVETWEKLLQSDPRNAEALGGLAGASARAGHFDDARSYLGRLKEAHPDSPEISRLDHVIGLGKEYDELIAQARSLARAGKLTDAVTAYQQAFGSEGPPRALALEYQQTLAGTKDGWQPAVSALRDLVEKYPEDARYRLALAQQLTYRESSRAEGIEALRRLGQDPTIRAEALAAWKQALLWTPLVTASEPLLSAYLEQVPDDADIARRQDDIRKGDGRATELQQGYAALGHADVRDADKLFKAAGSDPDALVGQALVALRRDEFDKARVLLERVKELAPDRPALWARSLRSAKFWSLMAEARVARAQGKYDVAEARFLDAAGISEEERPHANLELANLYVSQKQYDKAEQRLRQVLTARPDNVDAMRSLAIVLAHTRRVDEAMGVNEAITRFDRTKAFPRGWLASEELRERAASERAAGRLAEARTLLRAARDADPNAQWALLDLANAELELGDVEEAGGVITKLLTLHPDLVEARITQARWLALQRQPVSAMEALGHIPSGQMTPEVQSLKQKLVLQLEVDGIVSKAVAGKRSAARAELLVLQSRSELDAERTGVIAQGFADVGDTEHAEALMQEAIAMSTKPTGALRLELAAILLRSGRMDSAQEVLDDLNNDASLTPQERRGLEDLNVAYAVRRADQLRAEGNLFLAFSQLKRVLAELPDNPKLLCALGRLFQAQDDDDDARAAFRRVLQLNANDLEAREGAIESALHSSDRIEAKRLVEEGLRVAPHSVRMHLIAARFWRRVEDDAAAMAELEQAQAAVNSPTRGLTHGSGLVVEDTSSATSLLSRASTRFAGPLEQAAVDTLTLQDEIQNEIDQVRAQHRVEISASPEMRVRQGQSGLGALTELSAAVSASIPLAYTGRLTFTAVPIALDAGALDMTSPSVTALFGSAPTAYNGAAPLPQNEAGTALSVGYQYKAFSIDAGSTPLGFAVQNIVGGASWHGQYGVFGIALEASRRPVTDSLLSYAGTKDPTTGITWGGIMKQGGRLDLAVFTAPATYYVFGDYRYYTGENVADNQSILAGAGVEWKMYEGGQHLLTTGADIDVLSYQRNLRYFTIGNGGYFSPQAFVHAGVPFGWKTTGKLQLDVTAEPGVNWFREATEDLFPGHPSLEARIDTLGPTRASSYYPGDSSVAFAFDLKSRVSYPLTDALRGSFELKYHTAADYQEVMATLCLQFDFAGRRSAVQ